MEDEVTREQAEDFIRDLWRKITPYLPMPRTIPDWVIDYYQKLLGIHYKRMREALKLQPRSDSK